MIVYCFYNVFLKIYYHCIKPSNMIFLQSTNFNVCNCINCFWAANFNVSRSMLSKNRICYILQTFFFVMIWPELHYAYSFSFFYYIIVPQYIWWTLIWNLLIGRTFHFSVFKQSSNITTLVYWLGRGCFSFCTPFFKNVMGIVLIWKRILFSLYLLIRNHHRIFW